jgi:hypothetical protein
MHDWVDSSTDSFSKQRCEGDFAVVESGRRTAGVVVGGAGRGRAVRLDYQPQVSCTFLSEQISHQQSVSSTFLSEETSISHQPPAKRTGWEKENKGQQSVYKCERIVLNFVL